MYPYWFNAIKYFDKNVIKDHKDNELYNTTLKQWFEGQGAKVIPVPEDDDSNPLREWFMFEDETKATIFMTRWSNEVTYGNSI
jgi:hypothetical protein